MAQIATFAASPGGIVHAMSCERFGVDPAAGLTDDPVEAANLRAALLSAMARHLNDAPESTTPEGHAPPADWDAIRRQADAMFPDRVK